MTESSPATPTCLPDRNALVLESARLLLRPYRPVDGRMYAAMHAENRAHLREFLPDVLGHMRTAEDAEAQIQRMDRQWRAGEALIFGAWERGSASYVGEVYLANADWHVPSIEIGYFVVAGRTGQGFASEAGGTVIRFAFEFLRVSRIDLQCTADNQASARVAERLGFLLEGRQRLRHRKRDSSVVDRLWYGLLRSEWEQAMNPGPAPA